MSEFQFRIRFSLAPWHFWKWYCSELFAFFVLIFLLSVANNIVSFGFFRIIKQMDCGQVFVFLDFFYFFKAKELKIAILLVLIYFGITMIALFLFVLPIFYVMIPLMLLAPVFAYNSEQKISEIIKLTFKLGHKKWGLTFVTTLLNILLIYINHCYSRVRGYVFLLFCPNFNLYNL